MGLAGLAIAWRSASPEFGPPVGDFIGWIAIALFLLLLASYSTKAVLYKQAVLAEFNHPIAGNFFGTIAIAVLLLSTVLSPFSVDISHGIWVVGVLLTVGIAFIVVSRLLRGELDYSHAVPALLIPGVAALDITVTGARMPFTWTRELNLLALGIGGTLAILLLSLILSRLVHKEPLPKPMTPSLMILIAPFEVGFLAYTNYIGRVDDIAALLYFAGLFLFAVLFRKVFRREIAFNPGWWAISFPIAALVNAAFRYAKSSNLWLLDALAWVLLLFLTAALSILFFKTARSLSTGQLLRG
jgi:tellurite resistance protein